MAAQAVGWQPSRHGDRRPRLGARAEPTSRGCCSRLAVAAAVVAGVFTRAWRPVLVVATAVAIASDVVHTAGVAFGSQTGSAFRLLTTTPYSVVAWIIGVVGIVLLFRQPLAGLYTTSFAAIVIGGLGGLSDIGDLYHSQLASGVGTTPIRAAIALSIGLAVGIPVASYVAVLGAATFHDRSAARSRRSPSRRRHRSDRRRVSAFAMKMGERVPDRLARADRPTRRVAAQSCVAPWLRCWAAPADPRLGGLAPRAGRTPPSRRTVDRHLVGRSRSWRATWPGTRPAYRRSRGPSVSRSTTRTMSSTTCGSLGTA